MSVGPAGQTHGARLGAAAPAFVGRADEFARVVEALSAGPALVFIEGEAGIGKTRLVRECVGAPDLAGRTVLMAACPPVREPFPLGPVVDGLRRLLQQAGGRLELSPLGGALRPLFPEWVEELPPGLEVLDDPAETRHRLLRALTELVECLGVEVLVLEDAHWADAATLEWLLMLTASGDPAMSVVATFRPTDVAPGSLLPRLTSRLPVGMSVVRVGLEPLDAASTRELVGSMLGTGEVSEQFVTYLRNHTDGIPLALEETIRLMRERHDIILRGGAWTRRVMNELVVPPTVRDSVLERVERLDPDARTILQAAAIVGEPADEPLLTVVADLDEHTGRLGVAGALAAGLLRGADGGRLVFRHVLDSQAVAESIPASERWRLNHRAAQRLEQWDPPPVVRLARHHREAGQIEEWCRYAEAAAELALESGDDHTAVVTLLDVLTGAEHPPERRARLARKLGQAACFGASPLGELGEKVRDTLRTVLADGDLPRGERGVVRLLLGRVLFGWDNDTAVAEIEVALPDLADQPAQAARAMQYLAMPLTPTWPVARHLGWLARATALQPRVRSSSERLALLVNRATVLLLFGQEEGWQAAAEIPDTASSVLDNRIIAGGLLNVAQAAIIWGRYGEARVRLAMTTEIGAVSDAPQRVHSALVAGAFLDWYTGAWDGLANTAGELAEADETKPDARLEARVVQGLVEIASGHRSVAGQRLREVGEEFARRGLVEPQVVPQAAALGRLHVADGEAAEALGMTTPVVDMIAGKGVWLWATDIAPVHVDALVAAGELDRADDLADQFADGLAGRDAPAPAAALATCQAILAEAKGDPRGAVDQFAEAASAWAGMPRPYDALLASERRGVCLLAADEADEGLALLSDVQQRLDRLGARWDADRVAHVLREHGAEVVRTWRRGPRGYGNELSPRELEVARLVADGLTNRQVAERLFLSPHTISKQLSVAMRKLGVSSRTALAKAATDAGLLGDDRHP